MAGRKKASARKRRMTPEDLLRFTFVGDPQMSPDGETVLFTRKHIGDKNDYIVNLWRAPVDGGDPSPFTNGGKDTHGRWSPDGTRIAFIRSAKEGGAQIYMLPADGGEATVLTRFPEGKISEFKWSPDGKHLAVSFREVAPEWTAAAAKEREEKGLSLPPRVIDDLWYRLDGDGYFDAQRFQLYVVDTATGDHRRVFKDTLGMFSFDWSPDSRQLAIAANTDRRALINDWKDTIYRLDVRRGKLREIPGLPEGPKANVQWSPDGKRLAYAGRVGKDGTYSTRNLHLWVCDPVRGQARNLTGRTDYCLMAVALTDVSEATFGPSFRWGAKGRKLYLLLGWHGETHVASIPARGGTLEWLTRGAYDQTLGSFSADGKRVAMTRGTTRELHEIHVGELAEGSLTVRRLTGFNRKLLAGFELSKPTSHWVKTADGTKVQVWVMLPPGASGRRKLPSVLEIHGGPHAQYGVGFFHEFQVLAAAGYAVFYSNPRGSKGYGEAHTHAIHGHWGGADWVDIQAVTAFMKEQRFVDPKRMGVMGGSYGGYMTNWVIGHTNEFAGAISDRCVSNLVSMSGSSDFPQVPDRYWEGNFWDRPENLWRDSPIQYMGKAKTPTLLIHSEGDLRCNIEQSDQVYTLLTLRKVPTRFVRYPRTTSHGLSRGGPPDLRLHRLHQILGWWEKYLD